MGHEGVLVSSSLAASIAHCNVHSQIAKDVLRKRHIANSFQ